MKIYASKNYSTLSYMVSNQEILYNILDSGYIYSSEPERGKSSRFISLSRSLSNAAGRNPNRWKYGVLLDGQQLTERYKLSPYSYANNEYNSPRRSLVVKTLTKYDNGDYTLKLLNHPTKLISKSLFDELESLILSDSQGLNDIKKLQCKVGKRPRNGRTIVRQYDYNVPTGGIRLNKGILSPSGESALIHHTNLNETEERLYTDKKLVNISDSILGIIMPKNSWIDPDIEEICKLNNYSIQRY